ncbi:uncharacterized protein LOC141898083 isoform X2 [Acropora palmata]|uniref:uncharacterized protein LOC141898083 isoform X2 n=1 Tax=Acropora palmata TaxID=6131 RepID=UPI003DA058F7
MAYLCKILCLFSKLQEKEQSETHRKPGHLELTYHPRSIGLVIHEVKRWKPVWICAWADIFFQCLHRLPRRGTHIVNENHRNGYTIRRSKYSPELPASKVQESHPAGISGMLNPAFL